MTSIQARPRFGAITLIPPTSDGLSYIHSIGLPSIAKHHAIVRVNQVDVLLTDKDHALVFDAKRLLNALATHASKSIHSQEEVKTIRPRVQQQLQQLSKKMVEIQKIAPYHSMDFNAIVRGSSPESPLGVLHKSYSDSANPFLDRSSQGDHKYWQHVTALAQQTMAQYPTLSGLEGNLDEQITKRHVDSVRNSPAIYQMTLQPAPMNQIMNVLA